jgi:DNA polymerase III delta prime subunit
MQQLWQQMRIDAPDQMVGNTDALANLMSTPSGMILVHGPMGCGKTSLALAFAHARTGVRIEEQETKYLMGSYYVSHVHAMDFDISDAMQAKWFFFSKTPCVIIVDEAQELTTKRQQSRLKTMKNRPDMTLVFCTTDPQALDPAIVDRCVKVRLGPLSARDVPALVVRACTARDIPYDVEIVKALNRSEIFRPRAIIQAVDAIAAGKSIAEAVSGQRK